MERHVLANALVQAFGSYGGGWGGTLYIRIVEWEDFLQSDNENWKQLVS